MKKYILLFVLAAFQIKAQFIYTLSVIADTYTPLANPVPPSGSSSYTVTLPFAFTYSAMQHYTATVELSNDGYINFGQQGILSLDAAMNPLNSSTRTDYEVTGSAPYRIFKFEWKHHGFSMTAAADDSVSYQVWLY